MKEATTGNAESPSAERREFPRRLDETSVKVYVAGKEFKGNAADVSTGGIAIVLNSISIIELATRVIVDYMGFNFSGVVTSSTNVDNSTRIGVQWDDEVRQMLE